MIIHVECLPDEALLKKLEFSRKQVEHHNGKSKVFNYISKNENQYAVVDEDPGTAKHRYEAQLDFQEEKHGIIHMHDPKRNNRVFVIRPRLEDWIIGLCKRSKIDMRKDFSLPDRSNELHNIINLRLTSFDKLLDHLLDKKNESLLQLKDWLNSK